LGWADGSETSEEATPRMNAAIVAFLQVLWRQGLNLTTGVPSGSVRFRLVCRPGRHVGNGRMDARQFNCIWNNDFVISAGRNRGSCQMCW